MSTKGNLELRLPGSVLYRGVQCDGYRVYNALVELALLHMKKSEEAGKGEPSTNDFREWFKEVAPKVLPNKDAVPRLVGGVPCEVIIDTARRIVLCNGDDSYYTSISEDAPLLIEGSINRLRTEFHYQFLGYTSLAQRTQEAKAKEDALDRARELAREE